jgi:ribosomal protein L21E
MYMKTKLAAAILIGFKKLFYVISAALLVVSFGTVFGMAENISAKANATEQFTIAVTNLRLAANVDVPPAGLSDGDMRYRNGTLRSENETGPIIGEVFISNAVVKVMPGQRFMAMTNSVYTFKNKTDLIVVGGFAEEPELTNETNTRAISGGTGKYFGTRGQLVTTNMADGNSTNVITILR